MIAEVEKPAQGATQTLEEAAVAYAKAKAAVDAHEPPYRGPDYAAKISRWRSALLDLDAAARRTAHEKEQAQ